MNDLERATRIRVAEEHVAAVADDKAAAIALSRNWHHSAVLKNGEIVEGTKSPAILQKEYALTFGDISLDGLSVLDIGAWNGAFSFEAERRGARRVVAVDEYTWFVPAFNGLETFLFYRRNIGSKVEYLTLDIESTTVERVGTFDVVLFLGVFYHLENPLNCLRELARLTDKWLILETQTDAAGDPLPAMRYYPGTELGGDPTNWWAPNPPCMVGLLRNAGFAEVIVTENPDAPGRYFFRARKG